MGWGATASIASPNSLGLFATNKVATGLIQGWKNGVKVLSTAQTESALPSLNIFLAARNNSGVADLFSPREYAFASIGTGLTDTEAANLYTAVQAYETALGRQIAP